MLSRERRGVPPSHPAEGSGSALPVRACTQPCGSRRGPGKGVRQAELTKPWSSNEFIPEALLSHRHLLTGEGCDRTG